MWGWIIQVKHQPLPLERPFHLLDQLGNVLVLHSFRLNVEIVLVVLNIW